MKIQSGLHSVEVEERAWDTRFFGWPTARIGEIHGPQAAPDFHPLTKRLRELGMKYVTARLPQTDWRLIHGLESVGFQLVDGILTFRKELQTVASPQGDFRQASAADADAVGDLAARTFIHSRFHNDPKIPRAKADELHREWARNSCLGQGADIVWLVEVEGRLAGFCTCQVQDKIGTVVLVAVDPEFSGKGLGVALNAKACAWMKGKGVTIAEIQTQTSNLAAMTVYFRAGFKLHSSSFTLRWADF